jgi:hypothetical protein
MKLLKVFIPLVFFLIGLLLSFRLQAGKQEKQEESAEVIESEEQNQGTPWLERELTEEKSAGEGQPLTQPSGKFIIVENQSMTSDKVRVETGENVVFSTTIKNEGTKTKHLTHLCFNHSGGVTFGCLNGPQGPTLDPGEEFPLGGATVFTQSGTYSVWLTWSQDETNFYRPLNGSAVKVVVE